MLCLCNLYAQEDLNLKKSPKMLVRDAERLINTLDFDKARIFLEKAIELKDNFVIAYRLLGLVYARLDDYPAAFEAYRKQFELDPGLSRAAFYECGMACMMLNDYEKALGYFTLYQNADPSDYKSDEQTVQDSYNREIDQNIRNCEFARALDTSIVYPVATNLGKGINSAADEYLPTLSGDNRWLIYTSNRSGEDIWMSKLEKSNRWSTARTLSKAINTPRNEGMAKVTVCGRTIYFSACGWENVEGGCDIFEADFDTRNDFAVIDDVRPSKGLNSRKWDSQPAISCDGKTMYFASTREGSLGGTDLWMSTLGDDDIWDPPVNMGKVINTAADEEAPYIAPDGKTLYFSSNGHPGFGDADIFRTTRDDQGNWSVPVNIGPSVNTAYREAGIVISANGTECYFASSRSKGIGGLDIYTVPVTKSIAPIGVNVMMDAYVYDAMTKDPIEDVKVKLGRTGIAKMDFKTDENGRFFVCLPGSSTYSYILTKEGYETYVGANYFEQKEGEFTQRIEILLVPEQKTAFVSSNPKPKPKKKLSLYFDTGAFEISALQQEQLQKLMLQFKKLDQLEIKVTGFADDVGNATYNLNLSRERAKNAAVFLSRLGVPFKNIKYEGGGVVQGNIAKHQKRRVEVEVVD